MTRQLLVATRKGLFTVRGQGRECSVEDVSFLGDPVSLVCVDPRDGAWYAALDHGHFGVKLHRSEDRGKTWAEIATPTYPERPEGTTDLNSAGQDIPWSTKLIWSITPAGADQPGVLWCGTIPGGVFKTSDRGESWQLVEALWNHPARKDWFGGGADFPGVHSICVDPGDSQRVFAAVSCGGMWETTDGGESWNSRTEGMWADFMPPERKHDANIQDPHCVVQCAGSPESFWTQHHNAVFKSTDYAASWQEVQVPPSSFGFATAVHPTDPRTAWFVPAAKDDKRYPVDGKVVVARTRDGGETFEVLRNGLPQQHAYDLVYRHALDIDSSGDVLAFGSTTGTLWISENQGDLWRTVSKHLPPIYCVRFAQ